MARRAGKRVRVGLIGSGKHGSRYARHLLADCPGLELAAISRRSPSGAEQARQWQCGYYPNWQELVADPRIDAVIAVVPPTLNLAIARACAGLRKPLLVEKPLAGSLADAQEIVALSNRNLVLTVGQTLRYNSVIQALQEELWRIGRLYSFSANQRLEPTSLAWHEDPAMAGAGVSFHTAVHVFDALRTITGLEVVRVSALSRNHGEALLENLLAVLVEMEYGVVGTVDCSKVGAARSGLFEFVGEQAQLRGEQIYNSCELIQGQEITDLSPPQAVSTIVPLLRDWEAFLCHGGNNPVPGPEGLAAVRICTACLRSAREGAWVTL
ncbi:Gfo/Idh/MocA family protein [Desulfogranum mediterraneum]|uniref:Gfo/Idh/MocA family protein n=1 Tax=Desulfogranum mediterraneum TaxID=160661 RepID=UPI0003F8EA0E|nr:Gfo/Idh/MocA family oxidoreductase [Desulfogranum mediterraneum]